MLRTVAGAIPSIDAMTLRVAAESSDAIRSPEISGADSFEDMSENAGEQQTLAEYEDESTSESSALRDDVDELEQRIVRLEDLIERNVDSVNRLTEKLGDGAAGPENQLSEHSSRVYQ